ncbi:hypothetical protein TCAL_04494 [Tigriopus californicus]|uniref:Uncharacterized protein n=1 Tax=Tigriopus californicus TaxID=6832 RepID=A0A553P085_TIGCA|nr:hypothetical protein TCAL_04494 [Tigriopus californicus]|eukprot:TCALIF_04494-PA protein Name:"Protein of unknown function" AED:0.12 eAED:0.12 QI:46/1/1/1/0/0.5/2/199/218
MFRLFKAILVIRDFSCTCSSELTSHLKPNLKMKCFVAVMSLLAAANGQFLADTPDVAAAKQQFAAAYNAAAQAAASASPYAAAHQPANGAEAPAALPYVHEDIPAEPYVHIEPEYDLLGNKVQQQQQQSAYAQPQPQQPSAPAYLNNPAYAYQQQQAYPTQQQAYPAQQQQQQAYAAAPQPQQAQAYNLEYAQGYQQANDNCLNWRGEGVPCRTNFNQ